MYTTLVHSLWEYCTRVPPVGAYWPFFIWGGQTPKVSTSNTKVARYAYAFRVSKPYLLSLTPLVYLINHLLLESCCLLALNLSYIKLVQFSGHSKHLSSVAFSHIICGALWELSHTFWILLSVDIGPGLSHLSHLIPWVLPCMTLLSCIKSPWLHISSVTCHNFRGVRYEAFPWRWVDLWSHPLWFILFGYWLGLAVHNY